MQKRKLGAGGPEVSALGLGCMGMSDFYAGRDDAESRRTLERALELGVTFFDTAEAYGPITNEELVGEAIAGRRDEVFLVSKVLPHNASRRGTIAACERSLKRLRTDRLDAYLLHWPGDHALEDTFAAFDELQRAGKILRWGVSNFDVPDLDEALAIAGPGRIACNQVLYHLQERAVEHAVLPWCERHGVALVAYSPFGHDAFPAPDTTGGRALADIATARGASPRQVALAFLTRRPPVLAIPKAARAAHALDNAGAPALELSAAEIERIDAAFPRGAKPRWLPML